jgi:hypothetical protein
MPSKTTYPNGASTPDSQVSPSEERALFGLVMAIAIVLGMLPAWLIDPDPGILANLPATITGLFLVVCLLYLRVKLGGRLKTLCSRTISAASPPGKSNLPPMLVLRAQKDEAARALSLARSFGKISRRLWSLYGRLTNVDWMLKRRALGLWVCVGWLVIWGLFICLQTSIAHPDSTFSYATAPDCQRLGNRFGHGLLGRFCGQTTGISVFGARPQGL